MESKTSQNAPHGRDESDNHSLYGIPNWCPNRIPKRLRTVDELENELSEETLAGYHILGQCWVELGISWIESIDDFPKRECEAMRCDLRSRLWNSTLIEMGQPSLPYTFEMPSNPFLTIELSTRPSTALHHLMEPRMKKSDSVGHRWRPIDVAVQNESSDDTLDIIIAVQSDTDNFSNSRDGGPHQAIQDWEAEGLLPAGWAEAAVRGDIKPKSTLRRLGIPVVILENHVANLDLIIDSIEQRKNNRRSGACSNRFEV